MFEACVPCFCIIVAVFEICTDEVPSKNSRNCVVVGDELSTVVSAAVAGVASLMPWFESVAVGSIVGDFDGYRVGLFVGAIVGFSEGDFVEDEMCLPQFI